MPGRLALELQQLPASARWLWSSPAERYAALDAVVAAWEAQSTALPPALARVDAAVVVALNAVGLPRGTRTEVRGRAPYGIMKRGADTGSPPWWRAVRP